MSKIKVYTVSLENPRFQVMATNKATPISLTEPCFIKADVVLKSDFDKLAEALKYYADKSNWTPVQFGDSFSFLINDSDIIEDQGGKLALTVLKELGIEI